MRQTDGNITGTPGYGTFGSGAGYLIGNVGDGQAHVLETAVSASKNQNNLNVPTNLSHKHNNQAKSGNQFNDRYQRANQSF